MSNPTKEELSEFSRAVVTTLQKNRIPGLVFSVTEAYQKYADEYGRPPLTAEEKQLAVLNAVIGEDDS